MIFRQQPHSRRLPTHAALGRNTELPVDETGTTFRSLLVVVREHQVRSVEYLSPVLFLAIQKAILLASQMFIKEGARYFGNQVEGMIRRRFCLGVANRLE